MFSYIIEKIKELVATKEPEKVEKHYRHWSEAEMALFALSTDKDIALATNRTVNAVRMKRKRIRTRNDK